MKIIYFTTAQEENDYRSFIDYWKIPLNSSNQNFHNKFIRSLAIKNEVEVISIRPFSISKTNVSQLKRETKKDGNITWHYIKRSGGKIYRSITILPQVKSIMKKLDLTDSVFLTDTINTLVCRTANKVGEKYHKPVIGICTDSPSNIAGTKRSYTMYLLNQAQKYSGYIALTEGLKDLFNPDNKPSYIFEGIVEDRKVNKNTEKKNPYFFFGGALMERYGVYQLIEAFKILKPKNIDLYICGHHGDKEQIKIAIQGNTHIKFLGLLPVGKVLEYEQKALACINPRPFTEDLDRFSIPSKTLEYMVSGRPVISVKNTILQEKFPNELIWIESANESDLVHGMKDLLKMSDEEKAKLGQEAKNRVLKLYSLETISDNIQSFLTQFIK